MKGIILGPPLLSFWKLGLIDKLLLEHVGLSLVLDLTVHLVNFFGWISQGGHSEQLLFFACDFAHVIIVSAQSKELGFWVF